MGILKVGKINLNDSNEVRKLADALDQLMQIPSSYYSLRFKPQYYFEILDKQLPSERGWYVILEGRKPLYAGKADDLNARLNSNNGSIDNFANKQRTFDPERNFIKKFDELGIISDLRVCIISERSLCSIIEINPNELTELDRGNIEKIINLFRVHFNYLSQ